MRKYGLSRKSLEGTRARPVLEARASLGPDFGETLLEGRLKQMRPPQRLVILSDLHLGMKGAQDERVRMDPDQHMGALYPFSLSQKLAVITETSPCHADAISQPSKLGVLNVISALTTD